MGQLMKKRFVRKLSYRIDRDLSSAGEALAITICAVELNQIDYEGRYRSLRVPFWYHLQLEVFSFCLFQDKPSRFVNKAGECAFAIWFVTVSLFITAFAGDRHA
jgi:hypothetical protein